MRRFPTAPGPLEIKRSAHFSRCNIYRYALWRTWDPRRPTVLFIGLNPSTADAVEDDRTITRCISFAMTWGFGRLAVANLFALRATKPAVLRRSAQPVGMANNRWILNLATESDAHVAAWGNGGKYLGRDTEVIALLFDLQCLGRTEAGAPRHPLYVPSGTTLRSFVI